MAKIIMITGGSQGLGKAIAKELIPENKVVILSHNEETLKEAASELGCDYLVCDITKYEQIEAVIQTVLTKYGRIDVVINNAGIWIEGALETNDPEYIRQVLEVNTLGTIWFTRAVVPQMKKQQSGMILNVVSQAGLAAKPQRSVYNASKFAITGFTDALNLELGPYNIGVCGIYPYKMNTEMFEKANIHKDMSDALDPAEAAGAVKFMLSQQPSTIIPQLHIKNNSYKNKI